MRVDRKSACGAADSARNLLGARRASSQNGEADNLRTYKLARSLDMLGHVEHLRQGRARAVLVAQRCFLKILDKVGERVVIVGAPMA